MPIYLQLDSHRSYTNNSWRMNDSAWLWINQKKKKEEKIEIRLHTAENFKRFETKTRVNGNRGLKCDWPLALLCRAGVASMLRNANTINVCKDKASTRDGNRDFWVYLARVEPGVP